MEEKNINRLRENIKIIIIIFQLVGCTLGIECLVTLFKERHKARVQVKQRKNKFVF